MAIRFLLIVAATIWSLSGNLRAAPLTLTVGGAAITVPEPSGLVSLRNADSPYYRFMSEMQAANKNRLLAALVPPEMAREADNGAVPSPKEWAIVYTLGPRGGEPVSVEQFRRELVPVLDSQLERLMGDKKLQQATDAAADRSLDNLFSGNKADVGAAKLRLGVISPLGVYARTPNYYLYGAGTKISVTSPAGISEEMPIVMVLGFVSVKSRLFAIAVYRTPTTREDIAAVKSRAMEWAEAIALANP